MDVAVNRRDVLVVDLDLVRGDPNREEKVLVRLRTKMPSEQEPPILKRFRDVLMNSCDLEYLASEFPADEAMIRIVGLVIKGSRRGPVKVSEIQRNMMWSQPSLTFELGKG